MSLRFFAMLIFSGGKPSISLSCMLAQSVVLDCRGAEE
jgi:hypothetical protein